MPKFLDLTGKRYGRLLVLKRAENAKSGRSRWLCRCDCTATKIANGNSLRNADLQSCGCLRKETAARNAKALRHDYSITHGHTCRQEQGNASPTYRSWQSMKSRCYYPSVDRYPSYGGKGITVCDRWKDSFENFLADLGERPPGTTLGRFGDVGNYEPGNVSWMTPAQQAANRRPDRRYCGGRKKTSIEQIAA